jgi:uncharacterized membrane protein
LADDPHNGTDSTPTETGGRRSFGAWIKKMGWAAFFFFLLKGIAWLVIGFFGLELLGC